MMRRGRGQGRGGGRGGWGKRGDWDLANKGDADGPNRGILLDPDRKLRQRLQDYYNRTPDQLAQGLEWTSWPEIPTSSEILRPPQPIFNLETQNTFDESRFGDEDSELAFTNGTGRHIEDDGWGSRNRSFLDPLQGGQDGEIIYDKPYRGEEEDTDWCENRPDGGAFDHTQQTHGDHALQSERANGAHETSTNVRSNFDISVSHGHGYGRTNENTDLNEGLDQDDWGNGTGQWSGNLAHLPLQRSYEGYADEAISDPWASSNKKNIAPPASDYDRESYDFRSNVAVDGWGNDETANSALGMQSNAFEAGFDLALTNKDFNKIDQPWDSTDEYLKTHYKLLRENATRPLRQAVALVKDQITMNEDDRFTGHGIYDSVFIKGFTFAKRGLGVCISFAMNRVGKRIQWSQSKRLMTGSVVALIPVENPTTCKIGTVAGRAMTDLEKNPPELQLFFEDVNDIEIDGTEYVMVEHRGGYFEASKHTLTALQRMSKEDFPLSEHLVDLEPAVSPPQYLEDQPIKDASVVFSAPEYERKRVDILSEWPEDSVSNLDRSQLAAFHNIVGKRLSIVQGPPGTGKTYVSTEAVKFMLKNREKSDPPIFVSCQTNHALDQILHHISSFETDYARLGSRSAHPEVKKRNIYQLFIDGPKGAGSTIRKMNSNLKSLAVQMKMLMEPFARSADAEKGADILDYLLLKDHNLLNDSQCQSLENHASRWVHHGNAAKQQDLNLLRLWLGKQCIENVSKIRPQDFGFEYKELEPEFEALDEIEAEAKAVEDDDVDRLEPDFGVVDLKEAFTGAGSGTEAEAKRLLTKHKDMFQIPQTRRGNVYRYLVAEAKRTRLQRFKSLATEYQREAKKRIVTRWEDYAQICKDMKVVGVTTTGFSKYRGIIHSLQPKVVLIEEAAETLESPVTAACIPSLQHLILVGDHKQLRPHCISDLEGGSWNFDMSLFERLVTNGLEFKMLNTQRRMIPEVRRLVSPIYGDEIRDHESVMTKNNRPLIPGMGKIRTFFFNHGWLESKDDKMSFFNPSEADMIVGFIEYLFLNGVPLKDITVLTFYNGQRRELIKKVRRKANLGANFEQIRIATVDSYQGEENGIVLLSLVRNNMEGNVGFLKVQNRVCVALSRAQRGFFLFGNRKMLHSQSELWDQVLSIMRDGDEVQDKRRLGNELILRCQNHSRKVEIKEPGEWDNYNGGCEARCGETLPCGHRCPMRCHIWEHEKFPCSERCDRRLACGHRCDKACSEDCTCSRKDCKGPRVDAIVSPERKPGVRAREPERSSEPPATGRVSTSQAVASFHAFAREAQEAAERNEDDLYAQSAGVKVVLPVVEDDSNRGGTWGDEQPQQWRDEPSNWPPKVETRHTSASSGSHDLLLGLDEDDGREFNTERQDAVHGATQKRTDTVASPSGALADLMSLMD